MEEDEWLDVVDDGNRVTGKDTYENIYRKGLSHRIVHVFVFNPRGQLLLQKRAKTRGFCPGCICSSASGHVKSGESYEEAGKRELSEELGISGVKLDKLREFLSVKQDGIRKFLCLFGCIWNGKYKPNPSEVESAKFYDLDFLRKNKGRLEITPELSEILEWYLSQPNETKL